jgi:ABC-type lipoprotein release transport system permease subunit
VITVDPLLQRAFGFVRRAPAWSLAVALTVAGFAAARATAPLVTDAAADRSFVAEVDRAPTPPVPGRGLSARAYTTGLADSKTVRAVSDLLDRLPVFDTPLVSVSPLVVYTDSEFPVPVIRTRDGRQASAIAFALGDTVSTLIATEGGQPTSDGAADGIWVPDATAKELGIKRGDVVDLGLDYPPEDVGRQPMKTVSTTVRGIYRTSLGLPVSTGFDWQSPPIPLPTDPAGGEGPPHLLLGDTGTVMRVLAAMDDIPFVTWDVSWTGSVSIENGRDAAAALEGASKQFRDTSSAIGLEVSQAHGQPVILSSGVGPFLQRSEQAAAELEPVVSSISVSAQVMTVMVLAICVWLLTRSRRREHALSVSMGAHPMRLGATAAIEQLVPVVLGIGAAYAIVRWWPGLVAGDGSIDRSTIHGAVRSVLGTLPLAILVIVVSGFAAVWPLDSSSAGRAKRAAGAIHGETLVVAGAIATGAQLVTQRGSALDSGTALLFPLLAVLAGSVIVVRVAGTAMRTIAVRRSRGSRTPSLQRPRSLAIWLARRRLSFSLSELSALVIIVASGVGLFVYCSSVSADGRRGVSDKAAAVGGASATVPIDSTAQLPVGPDGFRGHLPSGWTVVRTVSDANMAPNVASDILAVDPSTFAAAAAWRPSFAGASLASLLRDVSDSDSAEVNVVVAGNYNDRFPDHGTMRIEFGGEPVRYRVVARIAAAPWQRERASIVIADARELARALPDANGKISPTADPDQLDRQFRTYVWSNGNQSDLSAALASVALDTDSPNVATAERTPSFVAFGLSLPYLRLVGITLLVVSLAAIVVLGARRRADLVIELAMTDKMGMSRRTIGLAVAGGGVLIGLVSSMIGVAIARVLVAFMIHRLDPSPSFAPRFSGGLSWSAVAVAALAIAVVSLAAALLEITSARRAAIAEVLRGAE